MPCDASSGEVASVVRRAGMTGIGESEMGVEMELASGRELSR
jgi:ribosomal protein S28E/S33